MEHPFEEFPDHNTIHAVKAVAIGLLILLAIQIRDAGKWVWQKVTSV